MQLEVVTIGLDELPKRLLLASPSSGDQVRNHFDMLPSGGIPWCGAEGPLDRTPIRGKSGRSRAAQFSGLLGSTRSEKRCRHRAGAAGSVEKKRRHAESD